MTAQDRLTGSVTQQAYEELVRIARRFVRSDEEARDLTHDIVAYALARGVGDWASPERRGWLRGAFRRHAAFVVRGEQRRRRREALAGEMTESHVGERWRWRADFLQSLPPSLRAFAVLVNADLAPVEITWLLRLSNTAFRQRSSTLGRLVQAQPEPPKMASPEPAVDLGPRRTQLLDALRRQGGRVVATHDPDGHAIFLRVGTHESVPLGNR